MKKFMSAYYNQTFEYTYSELEDANVLKCC